MSHYATLKGLGRAIAYFPQIGLHLGNPLAGIFLSQLMYWHDKTEHELGVYKTSEEWQQETGMSYSQQRTARTLLKNLGILTETEKRLEHKIYFKLNIETFDQWFENCINPKETTEVIENNQIIDSEIGERDILNSRTRNPQFGDEGYDVREREILNSGMQDIAPVIHKITTEITTNKKHTWLDLKNLKIQIQAIDDTIPIDHILQATWFEREQTAFETHNAVYQNTDGQKNYHFANWLITAYRRNVQVKRQRAGIQPKPETGLSGKQILMFARRLAVLHEFANEYAVGNETTEAFISRIAAKLVNPAQAKKWENYLKQVGFNGTLGDVA
ncbi:MAG: hypothetical protein QM666_00880 [Acinetobacter sp.]